MKEKKCAFCDQVKPVSDFYRDRSKSDGLDNYCRSCHNLRKRHNEAGTLNELKATNRERRFAELQAPGREWAVNRLPSDYKILVSSDALVFNWTRGYQMFGWLTSDGKGYTKIETRLNGKPKKYMLHIMVYAAFHPEVPVTKFGQNGYDVHHHQAPEEDRKNGTLDNSLFNLELMTSSAHTRLSKRIFTDREIWMAMALYEFSKRSQRFIADLLGISGSTLSDWWTGRYMSDVSAAYHRLSKLERRQLAWVAIDYWEIPRTDG